MPIDNLAKWTILPNWRQPVVERLSWLSAVLTSDSGAEQRFGLRWSPRRSFEPIFTVTGRVRALLDVSLAAAGAAEWYVPVWHDGNVLTAPLSLGAASITTDTAFREFKVGGYVMLWENEFTAEVHEVTSVGSGTVGIDPVTSRTWPIGTRVFPCVRARIGDIPELSRKTGTVFEGGIRFDISTDNDWSDVAATIDLPTYLTYRVLTQRPNRREDLSLRYERMIEDLDNEVGLTLRRDVSGLAFPVQSHSWLRLGREEHAKLRALLYDLSGRVTPLWVPTFDDDLLLADDVDAADTTLLIYTAGLDAFGVPFAGREHICILLRDGTHIFRQITGVVASGDTETVTLDAAVGQTFTRSAVHSVSFMSLCRQNADEVEFNHVTDAGNATEVTVSFRHAPDIRSATDIGIPLIGDTAMNAFACGPCVPTLITISPFFYGPSSSPYAYPMTVVGTGTRAAAMGHTDYPDGAILATVEEGNSVTERVPPVKAGMSIYSPAVQVVPLPPCNDLPQGGYIMIQQEAYSSSFYGVTSGVWARTYEPDGTLVSGPTLLAGIDRTLGDSPGTAIIHGAAFYAVVSGDPHVDILLAPNQFAGGNVRIRRINAFSHATVIADTTLSDATTNFYALYYDAMRRVGDNLLVYYIRRVGSGDRQVAFVIFDAYFNLIAGPVLTEDYVRTGVNDGPTSASYLSASVADDGSFVIGWQRALIPPGETSYLAREYRVRRYSSIGASLGASQAVIAAESVFDDYFTDTALSRDIQDFIISRDGKYLIAAETIAENPDPELYENDMWQHITAFENVGGTWVQVTTLRYNPTYYQWRNWYNPPFAQIARMNDDTLLLTYDFETDSTYEVRYIRAELIRCDCVPALTPSGPYFLLAAASLTGHEPNMYQTNMISGDSGAFAFAYMQGTESDGRFVQIASDNTPSTRTSTHDTDATSTVATYTVRTSDGRYLVLTGSNYPFVFGGESDIKARFFSASGVADGSATQIAGDEVSPGKATLWGLVPDDDGGYYFLHTLNTDGLGIGHRNASHGVVSARVSVMVGADTWGFVEHSLARAGDVLCAVHWRYYVTGKEARLVLSFYNLDLSPIATTVEISEVTPLSNSSNDLYVNVRALADGRFAVMWVDQPNGDDNFEDSTVRIRFFLPNGTAVGASQSLFSTGTIDEFSPDEPVRNPTDFVISASGNYLAVTESVNESGARITYLTLFENQSGTWVQVQTRRVDDAPDLGFAYFDYDSRLELLSTGELVVAYQQYGAGPANDIRARRFTLTECL